MKLADLFEEEEMDVDVDPLDHGGMIDHVDRHTRSSSPKREGRNSNMAKAKRIVANSRMKVKDTVDPDAKFSDTPVQGPIGAATRIDR